MFYTEKDKKRNDERFNMLKEEIDVLALRVNALTKTISEFLAKQSSVTVTLAQDAPHGLRKDGTPRGKPGPKGAKK